MGNYIQPASRPSGSRYFKNRVEAGERLAERLETICRREQCLVLAMDDGGLRVGRQIARYYGCDAKLLLSAPIRLPREPEALAAIDMSGNVAYNPQRSDKENRLLYAEHRHYIEQEKLRQRAAMHRRQDCALTVGAAELRDRTVVVVSDGLTEALPVKTVHEFLKPHRVKKLVVAAVFATPDVSGIVHMFADELVCLNMFDTVLPVGHYYTDVRLPRRRQYLGRN